LLSNRRMARQARKPCSGWGLAFMIASTSAIVAGPILAAALIILAGVHSAYRRWALGMCSVIVLCRYGACERAWLAMRLPRWSISTVVSVMRASTVCRMRREGTE